ncbi:hypothetical protein [Aquimarina spongiae]|uniref:DUF1330 domain-containing protein n=1 Tax=Aquimarina spongiae TaxID=570521 RepID=A0A1M6AD09_9FLAO|nr:hypothetical protein [Aquimarina spongiae]SHI34375.1 hypothetical protein SAMN04488508_101231 [Aquimarina spongiae]
MSQSYIEVTPEKFKEFIDFEIEGPFQMLNLLKFKEKVNETGTSGAEAYLEYMKAATPFFQDSKAKIIFNGKPMFNIIGPENHLEWDKVLIVEYASKQDFLGMITKEGYPGHLRTRALEDSRLILCTS